MTADIGPHHFDYVDWDRDADVLCLAKGAPPEHADKEIASPEGHHLALDRDGDLLAITLVGPQGLLEHDGKLPVSMPSGELIGHADVADIVLPAPAAT